MALIDALKHGKFHELTGRQRSRLKTSFRKHKQDLQKRIRALERALDALAKKPKRKKTAKRKTPRRRARG
jgi:hypothetical protein